MRRRQALSAICVAAATLAGCIDDSDPAETDTPADTPTESSPNTYEIGDTAALERGDVAVTDVTVQRSVIHAHTWRTVHEPETGQLLIVETEGVAPDAQAVPFSVSLGGGPIESETTVRLADQRHALSVPVQSVDSAALVFEGDGTARWTLSEAHRERLASAPEFHLHDATARTSDGETALELTVENRGDRDGTFRGLAVSEHAYDLEAPIRFPVAAGEPVTETIRDQIVDRWTVDDTVEIDADPETRRFAHRYPGE